MDAVSFLEYCAGCSIVLLSMGAMVKLMRTGQKGPANYLSAPPGPQWEPIPDPMADGLHGRLEAFQSARFASPIVQRTLSADAGPPRRDAVFPPAPAPVTVVQRMPRPAQAPRQTVQTKREPNKVVQLPLKQRQEDK